MKKDVQSTLSFLNGGTFYIQKSDLSNCLHPSLLRGGLLAPKVSEYIEEDGMGIRLK